MLFGCVGLSGFAANAEALSSAGNDDGTNLIYGFEENSVIRTVLTYTPVRFYYTFNQSSAVKIINKRSEIT